MTKTQILKLSLSGGLISGLAFLVLAVCNSEVLAQSFTMDFGDPNVGGPESTTSRIIQLIALTTVLSLAPSILVMVTSFTRLVIVFSFLRTAMGTQQAPPNQVIVSLALFLTFFIMMPTFEQAYDQGLQPYMNGDLEEVAAFEKTVQPFHNFMMQHVRDKDLDLFLGIAQEQAKANPEEVPLKALIPAFMISEIRKAFEIGFLLFIPFLVIDMIVASVLMSMGMMMLPPIIIALPFKIIFFVLVDGWYMLVGSLVKSFGQGILE
ncbi:flagellar type III secretion system pore protein FliP [Terasakiella sp. A23]|uniref:flagellar type III secretion system pore protein FliP n=1 Tax=Terasakiella sp. FCG-A23 TaxID=3080561 RepID=UPI0029548FAD|nr:flagellar type III secretion system pore protein FliP [Terasakiella sp. A23]MDV7339081.1 flagellar type III secretion system pore protein FliP [Terasakiella sp. A23]